MADVSRQVISAKLTDSSPEVRRRAVSSIAQLAAEDALELVLQALADDDWRVRKEAVALASSLTHSAPQMTRKLLGCVKQDDDIGLRNAATEALGRAGTAAITEVISQLPEMDEAGRQVALEIIGNSRDPRADGILIKGLEDPSFNVRVCAAEWLGETGGKNAINALVGCLGSSNKLLILTALQSLNRLGARTPWAVLESLSRESFYGAELVIALGRSGSPAAAGLIVDQLGEDVAAVRATELLHGASAEAARAVENALGQIDQQTHEHLIRLANEGEPGEQRSATSCLLWTRKTEIIADIVELARVDSLHSLITKELGLWGAVAEEALEQLLPRVRGRTLASVIGLLSRLLEEKVGSQKTTLFTAYLDSSDLAVATAAAGAVARFGGPAVVARLIELTGSEHSRVRRTAGHALVEIGRRHSAEIREKILAVEIDGSRGIQVCRVLEVVGKPEDATALARGLGSPLPELRRAVVSALAAVSGAGAVEMISLAMTDENLAVRVAAASSLARVGPAAAETIVSALHSTKGPLRAALIRALGQVGHPEAPEILRTLCRDTADVALAALQAMQQLGLDPGAGPDEILSHPDNEVVKRALSVLGDQVVPDRLATLLVHQSWDVRLAAVDRLSRLVDENGVRRALEQRLEREQDDLVRGAIERALRTGKEAE